MEEKKRYKPIPQSDAYKDIVNEAREKLPPSLTVAPIEQQKKEVRKHVAVYLHEEELAQLDKLVYEYKVQGRMSTMPSRSSVIVDILTQFFEKNP